MNNEDVEKLIQINQRLSLVLGYAMGFIKPPFASYADDEVFLKYKWLITSIENLMYLDKPLPPMP